MSKTVQWHISIRTNHTVGVKYNFHRWLVWIWSLEQLSVSKSGLFWSHSRWMHVWKQANFQRRCLFLKAQWRIEFLWNFTFGFMTRDEKETLSVSKTQISSKSRRKYLCANLFSLSYVPSAFTYTKYSSQNVTDGFNFKLEDFNCDFSIVMWLNVFQPCFLTTTKLNTITHTIR